MKKIIALFILLSCMIGLFPESVHGTSTGYFVVTAYYSPLPNQSAYIMGSYEAELRMNGMGIRGASGKAVFPGMLAAPKNYNFGTKIYLAGLGVGEVADRGGAIVPKGERGFKHDRIDVWMGHGEEGLRRAMYWGNRTVAGYIAKQTSVSTIQLKNHPAPEWATAGLKKISNIYNIGVGKHSDPAIVKKLQQLLETTGFYKGKINGDYATIMPVIYQFQIDNNLVYNEQTLGAGYWGELTRSLFLKKYLNGTLDPFIIPVEKKELDTKNILPPVEELEVDVFSNALSSAQEFRRLQEILLEIGLYDGELDGDYESVRQVVLKYQLGKDIVETSDSIGAGVFGPTTRKTLKNDYMHYQKEQENQQKREAEMSERKKILEEKFKELEALALEKVESKTKHIGTLKEGDISPAVRDLQNILKELGYFEHKDTAIYGPKTKKSIFDYQVDRGLISNESDIGAGICGPVTKAQIKNDLKETYLSQDLFKNEISIEELDSHGIAKF